MITGFRILAILAKKTLSKRYLSGKPALLLGRDQDLIWVFRINLRLNVK